MLRTVARYRWAAALVASLMLFTSVVEAQQKKKGQQNKRSRQGQRGSRGGRGGGFGNRGGGRVTALQLVSREEVKKELKITEEQSGIIRELQQASRPDFRSLFSGGFRDLSREEQQKKLAEMRKKGEAKAKEAEEDLFGLILEPPQSTRLKQIVLQQKGLRALLEPATAKLVGLTEAQTGKIKITFEAGDKKTADLRASLGGGFGGNRGNRGGRGRPGQAKKGAAKKGNAGGERKRPSREELKKRFEEFRKKGEEVQKKTETVRKETETAVLAVLTSAQKTKFEQLKGTKFDLPRRSAGARGSRGGNRGNRGGSKKRGGGRPKSTKKKNEA